MAEEDEAQVRGRPMLIKKRRSRVESFMLRKSASGAGEPVGRGGATFYSPRGANNRFDWRKHFWPCAQCSLADTFSSCSTSSVHKVSELLCSG